MVLNGSAQTSTVMIPALQDDLLKGLAWRNWLKFAKDELGKSGQEQNIAALFQKIVQEADGILPTSTHCGRPWSATNHKSPPRGGDVLRKPDLVCVDNRLGVGTPINDWRHFAAVGEVKSGSVSTSSVFSLLAERATTLFRHQDARRFVLTFALVRTELTLAFFDRGGSIVGQPLDILEHPRHFLRFLVGMSFADHESIGYESTVVTKNVRYINSPILGNVPVHCILFIADRMHSKGTVVWLGQLNPSHIRIPNIVKDTFRLAIREPEDFPVVVKSTWVDSHNSTTEGFILALLHHKGVRGVPRVLAEECVKVTVFKPPKHTSSAPDNTTLNRSRLGVNLRLSDAALKSHQVKSPEKLLGYNPRSHIRSFIAPWGMTIYKFRSGVELLGIMLDVLSGESIPYSTEPKADSMCRSST